MQERIKREMKNNKGFSLVELIIVIAIMAVLVGVLAPQFVKYVNNSKVSTDVKNGQELASAISAGMADDTVTSDQTGADAGGLDQTVLDAVGGDVPESKVDSTFKWTYDCTVATGDVTVYLNGFEVYPEPNSDTGYNTEYKK